jgi:hypothetical protein
MRCQDLLKDGVQFADMRRSYQVVGRLADGDHCYRRVF